MRILVLAFALALFVWLAPHNTFMNAIGLATYWITVLGVVALVVRRPPEAENANSMLAQRGVTDDFTSNLHSTWRRLWSSVDIEELEVGDRCRDPWTNIHRPKVDEWLQTLAPGKICEMGCGLGQWTRYYARNGRPAVGVDIVPEAIEAARQECDRLGLSGARFVVGDARRMPFDEKEFSGISSFGVVEHFMDSDLQAMIDESYRTLIRGGRLLLTTPNIWCMHSFTRPLLQLTGKWNLGLERSFSPRRLSHYLERSGFRILQRGVIESGTLFGDYLTSRIPMLEKISRFIERRQSTVGFVSYVIGERP